VFGNRVLRKMFGTMRQEVAGDRRRLHYEELLECYCSPNAIRLMQSGRMGWAGNVARMEEDSSACVDFYHATVGG
jgi:hypothetical protein